MKHTLLALFLIATSATCTARISPATYKCVPDTFNFCAMVDTCLKFPNDSTKYLNGNGNWVTITDTCKARQPFTYIAYGDSTNHITGDGLFTRDPIGQTVMLRMAGTTSTGIEIDTTLMPQSLLYGQSISGSGIVWFDTAVQTFAMLNTYRDPVNVPYPALMISAADILSNNSINTFYHINDTIGGVRNWEINNNAYNGNNQTRSMCNVISSRQGDVYAEMEAASDITGEKSNVGLYVNHLDLYHRIEADSIYLGVKVDTSGFSFWNYGRSGMGIGGYHFPQYHGNLGQALTDDGSGNLSFTYSGVLGGSVDTTVISLSVLTVNLPFSISTAYKVVITPSNLLTASNYYWVDSKTATSFKVNFAGGLPPTGEIKFDWILTP